MTEASRSPSLRDVQDRIQTVLASPRIARIVPPRADAPWGAPHPAPPDLDALYRSCDGLVTENGFTLLGRGEVFDTTRWLVLDKALSWPDDLLVIGERTASVVVVDLDVHGSRAGGGVLEAASDDLETFERVASDALAYISLQIGLLDPAPPAEVRARRAADEGRPRSARNRAFARAVSRPRSQARRALSRARPFARAKRGRRTRASRIRAERRSPCALGARGGARPRTRRGVESGGDHGAGHGRRNGRSDVRSARRGRLAVGRGKSSVARRRFISAFRTTPRASRSGIAGDEEPRPTRSS